ncbi:MAG: HAMP domain-containing sensor histidine kinase [Saprospiraceae bacterium]
MKEILEISPAHSPWLKIWFIGLILLFLGKTYEHYYVLFGHDHGHVLACSAMDDIRSIESTHEQLVRKIPSLQDDYADFHKLLFKLDQIIRQQKELSNRHIIICKDGSPKYWNADETFFDNNWASCNDDQGKGFFSVKDQYYYGIKSPLKLGDVSVCLIDYKQILDKESLPADFSITNNRSDSSQLKLLDSTGKSVGFIYNAGTALSTYYSNFLLAFYLFVLLLLSIPFHYFSRYFFDLKSYSWGFLIWLTGILMIISISQWMIHDTNFYDSFLTHSRIETSLKTYTFFEFLVLAGMAFHMAYFWHNYYPIQALEYQNNLYYPRWIIPVFNYIGILLSLSIYCTTFKSIFGKSAFYLDMDRLVFMPIENYFLILSLVFILLSVFLISHKLNQSSQSFHLPFRQRLAVQAAAYVIFFLIYPALKLEISAWTFLISSIIIILLQEFFLDYSQNNILWLISWIIIVSFLTSSLVFHYQNVKIRNIKSELINNFIRQNSITTDTTGNAFNKGLPELIRNANENNLSLVIFEDNYRKYSNTFSYPDVFWAKRTLGNDTTASSKSGRNEMLLTKAKPDYLIMLGHQIPGIIKAISLFSYLFTALIILAYLTSLVNQKYRILPESLSLKISERPSLRNRIQFYVILSIVFSFLTIAVITVFFTKKSEEQISNESLSNKLKYFSQTLERSVQNYKNQDDIELTIRNQVSDSYTLFDYKIQYFDNNGFEIPMISSNKAEVSKHLLCDPLFYFQNNRSPDEVALNKYLSESGLERVSALKNILVNNQRAGIIKMSSDISTSASGHSRLANLINTLLNIYVFLFLISASMATFLANSITSPLEVLSRRIRQIRLGKNNEPLEWSGNDEIGELINDYNRMVDQLDESANLLAKSERDSAWREMAKQVAHEIKNPLTPMKLNIQYLQQQIKSGSGSNHEELVNAVADSILEQIEGLTKIATEFSNFAKMPKAENERILINDLISSVHDLFRKRDDIDILLKIPIDELYVFCDRTQMIRVLNNLINNAIQAIPDDRRGMIDIKLIRKTNKALISIQDNGIGIPDEMKEKIFLPNFTTKTSGTGLGLAMCQQIIESINGALYFHSSEGSGTTFYVQIPLMKSEQDNEH